MAGSPDGSQNSEEEGIPVRGADGKLLDIEGVRYIYAHEQDCMFWKWIKEVVTTQGNHCLISLKNPEAHVVDRATVPDLPWKGQIL